MSLASSEARSNFRPHPPADLSSTDERARLSGPGLKDFFRIQAAWGLGNADAAALLGGVSNGRFFTLKRSAESGVSKALATDILTRISLVIGLYKALHTLHGDALADRWMSLANRNAMFGGETPLSYAVHGGIPALQNIRNLLDARGGYLA